MDAHRSTEKTHKAGPIIGVIMALTLCGGFFGVVFFDGAFTAIWLLIVPLLILVPLAIINFILSVFYVIDRAPARTYLWMWGLPLVTFLTISVIQEFR